MKLHEYMYQLLMTETGIDTQFRKKPNLTLAFNEEEKMHLKGRLSWQQAQQGYQVKWLNHEDLKSIDSRISNQALGGVFTEGTAEVDSYRLVLALTQAAEKQGVEYRLDEVIGLKTKASKVTGVITKTAEFECEQVLFATGPWGSKVSKWLNITIPVRPLKGQIIKLQAPGPRLEFTMGWSGNYATTKPDGLLWAGTTEEEVGFDDSLTTHARNSIMKALLTMLPSMESASLVTQTACLRPVSSDGLLLLGQIPSWEGVYIANGAGRKGILLGLIMAKIIANLMLGVQVDVPIEPFRIDRFTNLA
jgi:glycine/D-amino acid oxidase-like deaminating enzyme